MADHTPAPWAATYARRIHALRWPIIAVWAVIIAVGLSAMDRVVQDSDVLVYFDRASAERQDFEAIAERFGRSNEVVTLVVSEDGEALGPASLRAMATLTALSAARDEVKTVRSPLSAVDADPDAVLAMDGANLADLAEAIRAEIAASGDDFAPLIAPDETLAVVAAIVDAPQDNVEVQSIAQNHRALKEEAQTRSPDVTLMQTGRIMIDDAFLTEGRDDVNNFVGTQFLLLLGILFVALGSVSLVSAMAFIIFAIIASIHGFLGLSGIPINGISSAAPAVLMGLVTATAIHVAMAWQDALRAGADRVTALAIAYDRNTRPVVISIATTMISFLLLNIAESPPFRQLGNLVALGLVMIFAIAFTLLPALLSTSLKSMGRHRLPLEAMMGRLAGFVVRRWRTLLAATAVAAVVSGAGAASITIDDTFSHYFDERYEVRRATDVFEEKLSGTTIIDLAVDTGREGGAFQPEHLTRLGQMEAWLAARPEVARTTTLLTAERSAAGAPLAAVAEAMAEAGNAVVVSADGRHSRIAIVMRGVSSRDTLTFADDARAAAIAIFPDGAILVTGMPVLSAQLSLKSTEAMFVGMGIALVSISLVLMVTLRSMRLGLISLAPNLLPVMIAFGLWGAFAGEVSFAATVVGALTYGIVVDDTVHILAKYQRFKAAGLATLQAMQAAFRSVGIAVVVTSLAIGLSFLPFALSGFLVNRHFGALTALTLLAAMVADLLFLPALLAALDKWRARMRPPAAMRPGPGGEPISTAAD